jgi:predicted RNase H-related nuclease YkuK (DUF458 family)
MNDQWFTGSGYEIEFSEILLLIKNHIEDSGKIFIGTDSFLSGNNCIFAKAICLHMGENQPGGRYFIQRTRCKSKPFKALAVRMLAEVERTVNLALSISEVYEDAPIEIHIDVSSSSSMAKTAQYSEMITGYAKSSGFSYKVKPHSWASSSVADKHSK